jgi:hypothetical protein
VRAILYALGIAAAASAFAQDASLLRYEGADRVQKAAAAAKKEGAFTLYTSFAEKDLPQLTAAFEKRYGIKVRVWRSASEKVLQRAVVETSAGRHDFDAVHTSALEMEALYREQILHPVAPAHGAELLAGAVRPHRAWTKTCRRPTWTCSTRGGRASSASRRACPSGTPPSPWTWARRKASASSASWWRRTASRCAADTRCSTTW